MTALGFPVFRYRLAAFTISGTFGGLAGILLANEGAYVSPAMMSWMKSGDLIVIVVLGGMGTLFGPLLRHHRLLRAGGVAAAAAQSRPQGLGRILDDRVRPAAGADRAATRAAASTRCSGRRHDLTQPLLRTARLVKRYRRPVRHRQRLDRRPAGRDPRADRPERRRQDHLGCTSSPATSRRTPAPSGSRAATITCLPTHARAAGPRRAPSRSPRCCASSPRSRTWRWPCRAMPAIPSASWPTRAATNACAARPAAASKKWASATARTCWPPPSAMASSASSRSPWRWPAIRRLLLLDEPMAGMGVEESQRMIGFLRALKQQARHAADRARHGRRLPARRPHHRAGLWPRHRAAARPTRSAPTPDVRQAYLGDGGWPDAAGPRPRGASTAPARRCSAWNWASMPARS